VLLPAVEQRAPRAPAQQQGGGRGQGLRRHRDARRRARMVVARAAARARGRHTGRPPRLTADQVRQVRSLRAAGESIAELVGGFGVSRATIYRALGDAGDGEPAAGAR